MYLEIACNLAAEAVPAPTPHSFPTGSRSDPAALADAVAHAANVLNGATKPVLVAGPRIRPPECRAAFRKLADRAGYAVAVQPAAKGMFPEGHPAFAGTYWGPVSSPGVAALVESADAYLFAGAILSDYSTTGYSALIDPAKLLLLNDDEVCLPGAPLYGRRAGGFPGGTCGPGPTQRRIARAVSPRGPYLLGSNRGWYRFD